jgi:hypothetical protein
VATLRLLLGMFVEISGYQLVNQSSFLLLNLEPPTFYDLCLQVRPNFFS